MTPRPRKKKNRDLPQNLYHYGDGAYIYRRPTDGRKFSLGKDRARAKRLAERLNAELMPPEYAIEAAILGRALGVDTEATLATVIDRYETEYMPERKLSPTTEREYMRYLRVFRDAIGQHPITHISVRMVANLLDQHPANTANKYRSELSRVFRFAIAKGLTETDPAAATLKRREEIQRQRLTLSAYRAIWRQAEPWLRNAMDLGLQTLQRREDIARLKFSDEVDGKLLVQQKKVERHGTGKLAILITPPLQAIIERCRDDIASPFMIHRRPQKIRADHRANKAHWTQIKPDMLSRAFKTARDSTGLFTETPAAECPTFHEIRALGARLYKDAGIDPQALLGHTDEKMTRVYLDRHEIKWVEVEAGLAVQGSSSGVSNG